VSSKKIINEETIAALESETAEVQSIVKSVQKIVKMVQDMSIMITEQGTIVDRIDYNLEVASVRTLKGKEAFKNAENLNKKAGAMSIWCIGALLAFNTFLAIIIMWKIKTK